MGLKHHFMNCRFSRDDFPDAKERFVKKGDVLFYQGDEHEGECFLILDGCLAVKVVGYDGREAILYTLESGDLAGELGALRDVPRTTTLTAVSDTRLAVLPRTYLFKHLREEAFMARMLGAIIRRYHMSQQVIERLTRPSAALRLCQFIADEIPEADRREAEVAIRLPSHEQMASRLACTRETISRSFHQLSEAGVLYSTGRGKYRVRPQPLMSFMTG